MYTLSKGPKKKPKEPTMMTTLECKKVLTLQKMCYFLYYTSDWFKHEIEKKKIFAKQHVFLNKFLITKSCLIESNLHKNPMCGKCKINQLL